MVYPRTHGETRRKPKVTDCREGLSPYTRGNPEEQATIIKAAGSIPVHTGKPDYAVSGNSRTEVYPRTHGETLLSANAIVEVKGLSPYTRGNQEVYQWMVAMTGSIPVHTGKPRTSASVRDASEVYPRTHGETCLVLALNGLSSGLSPYTRGNQRNLKPALRYPGSIPVHTGKPRVIYPNASLSWVYPRTHGETMLECASVLFRMGLSPYTRGNHTFTR